MKVIIKIDPEGRISLPGWVWNSLYKKSGLRSKKYRKIKKVVKREFIKLIKQTLKEVNK